MILPTDKFYAFQAWYQAGGDGPYLLWLSSGLFYMLILLIVGCRLVRRILGHHKFRGTWYNEKQLQELLMMIYIDQQKGNRVMRHDESDLLRRWELGSTKVISKGSGLEF